MNFHHGNETGGSGRVSTSCFGSVCGIKIKILYQTHHYNDDVPDKEPVFPDRRTMDRQYRKPDVLSLAKLLDRYLGSRFNIVL